MPTENDAAAPPAESAAPTSAPAPGASSSGVDLSGLKLAGAYGPPPPDGGLGGLAGLGASGAYGAPAPPIDGPPSKVSADVGTVEGDTSRVANAARVLAGGKAGFRRCYFLGLQENSKQQGQVTFHVSVDANGAVSKVDAKPAGTLSERVVSCMSTRIKYMQFDPPAGGTPATLSVTVKLAHPTD